MLLACDIGNTNIKSGLFYEDKLIETKILDNQESFSAYLQEKPVDKIAISSVVPKLTKYIIDLAKSIDGPLPFIITKDAEFNLKINYSSPETLGIDRICSAEGAFSLFKNSADYKNYNSRTYVLSIDLGTATTINIVKYPGEFTGGIIAPGLSMMFESLNSRTAQLPNISEKSYENFIGSNTNSSIASGVINSSVGLIKNTLDYLKSGMNAEELKIFITGGNAEKLLPYCNFEYKFVPELVLLGVKTVYDLNNKLQ
jgi:type III pantothenate kinase